MSNLYKSDGFWAEFKECLLEVENFELISAYITEHAVDELLKHLNKQKIRVLCRFKLSDIKSGASSFQAIRLLLEQQIPCFFNES